MFLCENMIIMKFLIVTFNVSENGNLDLQRYVLTIVLMIRNDRLHNYMSTKFIMYIV